MQLNRKAAALGLGFLFTASAMALPPKYTATKLPSLNPDLGFYTTGINLGNLIVGTSYNANGLNRAATWTSGGTKDLGTLGGQNSYGVAVSDLGDIVGQSQTADGVWHAFLFTNGKMVNLGGLGKDTLPSYAYGVSKNGISCGAALTPAGDTHAVYWDGKGIHDMGVMKGGKNTSANAVNANFRIVGDGDLDNTGTSHAFFWVNGKYTWFIDKSVASSARAINNGSHVTGIFGTPTGSHAFYWDKVKTIDLGTLGGSYSLGLSINQTNLICGTSRDANGSDRAFVWIAGTMYDLNSLLTVPTAVPLVSATGINNKGYITAVDAFGKAYLLKRL
jgi:probable HAF family extracellular repeat protein